MRLFCTLSDWKFLPKGIALYESLKETSSEAFGLYYLCLDDQTFDRLTQLQSTLNNSIATIFPLSLSKMEQDDPELTKAKTSRPYNEYCWTLASYLCNRLIHEGEGITYIDSDIFFYKDIQMFFDELGSKSVGIIAHRHNQVGHQDGAYNVGVIYFRNDKAGNDCLGWWSDGVLHKKYPHLQSCGDQKYLEEFIPRFGIENVCIVDHIGHAAPWNYRLYEWSKADQGIIKWQGNEQPLVFTHFSRLSYNLATNEIHFTSGQYMDHTLNGQVFNIPQVRQLYIDYYKRLKKIHQTYIDVKEIPQIKAQPLKLAFGMIVFNGDHVLKQCLESVYPYASQILIAEGPVKYWQERGFTTSNDETNQILESFPDPHGKITIVHGQFLEKDDECRAYMKFLKEDNDYLWNLDSDEVFKSQDIEALIKLFEKEKYTSVGIKSCSFYGGFDRYMGGFEEERDQFLRVFRIYPGSTWLTHRPPTMAHAPNAQTLTPRHMNSDSLWDDHGIRMYHYSYLFPKQVKDKTEYYHSLASGKFIPDYFSQVYLPWVKGSDQQRDEIEKKFNGVHEYLPEYRRPTFTKPFDGTHPAAISGDMHILKEKFSKQLEKYDKSI